VGVVIGVDGGNTKTHLVAASTDGDVIARAVGPGSNSHGIGAEAVAAIVTELARTAPVELPVEHGAFYLCGADVPDDVAELRAAIVETSLARAVTVDNDTFALLRAGTDRPDAVAVVCGAGINSVGRRADGRLVRYPALGWETGDWGGAEMLGRDALSLAARAEDGRGRATALVELVRSHFGRATVEEVGIDVHYRRVPQSRLGELAPLVVRAAAAGDAVAGELVDRLAREIVLLVKKAMRDLELVGADVVLGGGMVRAEGMLVDSVRELLPAGAAVRLFTEPPVTGAVLAALDAVGASDDAKRRVREELHGG
jgi:N-acetylglucosamine kinase-like BadF-type ATPase